MNGLLFVTGWGLDPRFAAPLSSRFPDQGVRVVGWAQVAGLTAEDVRGRLVVAHSLGAFEVLSRFAPWPLAGAVLCSVGTNFTRASGAEGFGVPARVLGRMVDGMTADPAAVLRSFHENVFAPEPVDPSALPESLPSVESLIHGLVRLRDGFARPQVPPAVPFPVALVHGREDRILDPRTAHALADGTGWPLTELPGAGHGFPFTRAEALAAVIRSLQCCPVIAPSRRCGQPDGIVPQGCPVIAPSRRCGQPDGIVPPV